jgi:prepilin-type N-terminal cleavage/methylation domain-containing protein
MLKEMKNGFAAVGIKLLRLSLAVTIWSCHAWAAPIFRVCHGLAAIIFGLSPYRIRRSRVAAIISQAEACGNLSLGGVKQSLTEAEANPEIPRLARNKFKKNGMAAPSGLAMTCQQSNSISTNYSEFLDSRPRVVRYKSIPRIWGHRVKPPMGQGEIPGPELQPAQSDLAKTGRTPNFKGLTLIEVIVVMIIIGILAATVLPRIDFGTTSSRASVDVAAYMIASDIRYAQEWAMANRTSKTITFDGSSTYTFNPASTGMDPSGRLQGATVSSGAFTFNSLGEPTTGGGSSVTVSDGVNARTITVTNYTGKVSY